MSDAGAQIVVFWSWQSDSPADTNRTFIEKCLSRACKRVAKDHAVIISVDRDTRGVGGTPPIAETILTKIRSADVFVWDATFVNLAPKAAPNPNVLFELGYAFAVLGEGRLIGVMNTSGVPDGTPLPFDLNHRRWPIKYALSSQRQPTALVASLLERGKQAAENLSSKNKDVFVKIERLFHRSASQNKSRDATQDELTNDLVAALKAALKEPKLGALRSDVDFHAAHTLWKAINSEWLRNWHEMQCSYPQCEDHANLEIFSAYARLPEKPENRFRDEQLASRHGALVGAIEKYLSTSAIERVPGNIPHKYVISTKASTRHVENYDAKYERQINTITATVEALWAAWGVYVDELRARYPEITSSSAPT